MKKIGIIASGITLGGLAIGLLGYSLSEPSREEILKRAREEARAKVIRYGKGGDAITRKEGHDLLKKKFREHTKKQKDLNSISNIFENGVITTTNGVDDKKKKPFRPEFTKEERELMDKAFSALSSDDVQKAQKIAKEALKSKNPEVRKAAVEAIGKYGEAGLVELSQFLNDEDPSVAELANTLFALGVQQIDEEAEMVAVAKLGMLNLTEKGDLDEMAGTMTLAENKALVIDALADVIASGTEIQVTAAKEAYEAVTGDAWTDEAAADAWIQENCDQAEITGESVDDQTPEHEDIVITIDDIRNGR